jgi:hypothetical protein
LGIFENNRPHVAPICHQTGRYPKRPLTLKQSLTQRRIWSQTRGKITHMLLPDQISDLATKQGDPVGVKVHFELLTRLRNGLRILWI